MFICWASNAFLNAFNYQIQLNVDQDVETNGQYLRKKLLGIFASGQAQVLSKTGGSDRMKIQKKTWFKINEDYNT